MRIILFDAYLKSPFRGSKSSFERQEYHSRVSPLWSMPSSLRNYTSNYLCTSWWGFSLMIVLNASSNIHLRSTLRVIVSPLFSSILSASFIAFDWIANILVSRSRDLSFWGFLDTTPMYLSKSWSSIPTYCLITLHRPYSSTFLSSSNVKTRSFSHMMSMSLFILFREDNRLIWISIHFNYVVPSCYS